MAVMVVVIMGVDMADREADREAHLLAAKMREAAIDG